MEFGLRFIGALQLLMSFIAWPIYYFFTKTPSMKVPPLTDPILLQSATKLARKIRKRELKSEDVIKAYINRIKEVNPVVNAIVEERFAVALEEAREADEIIEFKKISESQLESEKPLFGVPITIKESCSLKGYSLAVGSLTQKGVKADQNGDAVNLLLKAGAIPLLISTTPEYCLSWETNNLITGKTLNPYNTHRTSGGSSGGEGALLGSGASVIGIGSDIAGSIRLPAMFNGIYGHKPSEAIVSLNGHCPSSQDKNFKNYLTIGPMTRYAEDLRPMLKVLSGNNESTLKLNEKINIKEMKVIYMEDAGFSLVAVPVDYEIKTAIRNAANYLKKCGAETYPVKFKEMEYSVETSCSLFFGMEDVPNLLQDSHNPKECKNIYLELLKSFVGLSQLSVSALMFYLLFLTNALIPKKQYGYYAEEAKKLKNKFQSQLGDNGVFLYPTVPVAAFRHNESFLKSAAVMYTIIFNILGLPATHVPLGLNREGMPIGIQVVAGPNQDRLCLAVAEELEKGFGGWIPPS